MKATIRSFEPVYMARIAQLTNKSNQFNLTTQRMTQAQIEQMAADDSYITLYGKLEDKFGDNGVVSVCDRPKGRESRACPPVADELPRPETGYGACNAG